MACALCLKDLPLCASHIIPEFMYKSIYAPGNHRLRWIHSKDDLFDYRHKTLQKGLREALLCGGCEGQISQ